MDVIVIIDIVIHIIIVIIIIITNIITITIIIIIIIIIIIVVDIMHKMVTKCSRKNIYYTYNIFVKHIKVYYRNWWFSERCVKFDEIFKAALAWFGYISLNWAKKFKTAND